MEIPTCTPLGNRVGGQFRDWKRAAAPQETAKQAEQKMEQQAMQQAAQQAVQLVNQPRYVHLAEKLRYPQEMRKELERGSTARR